MCITDPLKISDFQGNLLHMLLFSQKHAFYFSILRIKEGLSHVQQPHMGPAPTGINLDIRQYNQKTTKIAQCIIRIYAYFKSVKCAIL